MAGKWTRRRLLAATGAGVGAGVLQGALGSRVWAADEVKACTLTPELEIGPYYIAYELMRSDIREGRPGVPLHFALELRHARTCAPIPHAAIDVWHCDAVGIYSGYTKVPADMFRGGHGGPPGGPGGPPPQDGQEHGPPPDGMGPDGPETSGGPGDRGGHGGPPGMKQTDQETFLRGVQVTDAKGRVGFETVFPGWYAGRDTHIHVEVHIGGHTIAGAGHASDAAHTTYAKYDGGHVCHIGQIAFADELSDEIARLEPYRQHRIERTRLHEDHVFQGDPTEFLMQVRKADAKQVEKGLTGTVTLFVDPDATPKPVGMGPGGGPGGRPPGPPPSGERS